MEIQKLIIDLSALPDRLPLQSAQVTWRVGGTGSPTSVSHLKIYLFIVIYKIDISFFECSICMHEHWKLAVGMTVLVNVYFRNDK